jgi:phosphodiesterase/alkaline phosphatase D-like protein
MRKLITAAAAVAALVGAPVALAASSPIVTAGTTTSIGQNSATLHATVNPNGLATTYQFHYGPTSALGSVSPTTAASAGSGTTGVAVSTKLSGLSPDTTYYFQLVASNSAGTSSTAIDSFKTTGNPAPTTTTSPAVDITRYSATLVGVINPNNQTTAYHFDYGLTTSYGFQSASKTLPAGSTPVAVGVQLPGLQPGQVYHYRLVADHGAHSVTYGTDMTFQTPPWPRPHSKLGFVVRPGIDARAPFVYVLTGSVGRPPQVPVGYGCHGTVTISVYLGARKLAARTVPVGLTTCTYRSVFRFAHIAGNGPRRLTVKARYVGDEWDAPSTHTARVWAG